MNCIGCDTKLLEPVPDELCGFCRNDPTVAMQQHVARLRAGQPLIPLTREQATAQAVRLRGRGLSYSSIAAVMELYHAIVLTGHGWRCRCVKAGVPALRSRGVPFARQEAVG